jgi:RNA polymerase sigma factor (TIGR02999 family)
MSEVTDILSQIDAGGPSAAEQLLPLVYNELRNLAAARLAQEKPGQTLQATALVHEAYLRLVGKEGAANFNSRGHFFCAAAQAMRRILVEQARRKHTKKRGQNPQRVDFDEQCVLPGDDDEAERLLAIDDALKVFEAEHPRKAQLVKLRYFAGMSLEEAATVLGVSLATAKRDWAFARAWLFGCLREDG